MVLFMSQRFYYRRIGRGKRGRHPLDPCRDHRRHQSRPRSANLQPFMASRLRCRVRLPFLSFAGLMVWSDIDRSLAEHWRTLRRGTRSILPGMSLRSIHISLLVLSAPRVRSLEQGWGIR